MEQTREFCKRLEIPYCDELVPFYEKGVKMKEELGTSITEKSRLIALNNEYNIFRRWFADILEAADKIGKDSDILLYSYILASIIKEKADVSILPPPDRGVPETDFSPMFGVLWFLEDAIEILKRRKLSYQIISDTLNGLEPEITAYYERHGRSGTRHCVGWLTLFVNGEIIRVGRLQYQFTRLGEKIRVYEKDGDVQILVDGEYMHKKGMVFGSAGQDDDDGRFFADIYEENGSVTGYPSDAYGRCVPQKITLNGYREVLRYGDPIANVHIPPQDTFNPEICEQSFAEAEEILKNHYSDFGCKAFYCHSWLLQRQLRNILGKDTNITRFSEMFRQAPTLSAAKAVYPYLFHSADVVTPKALPEDTSMQKAVKAFLCDGNYFYEQGGVRLFKN